MIVVRNVFQLKFGMAKEAVAAMKESIGHVRRTGGNIPVRLLTDLTGDFYTLVFELTFPDMAAFEQAMKTLFSDPQMEASYRKFTPLVESGRREVFTVVDA